MSTDRRSQSRVTRYRVRLRDGSIQEVEYQAIDDALHFACRDLREGTREPLEITEDGVVVHDAKSIRNICAGYGS